MDSIHSSAPQKTKAVLQVQDLQVYYGESHALQGVSLRELAVQLVARAGQDA